MKNFIRYWVKRFVSTKALQTKPRKWKKKKLYTNVLEKCVVDILASGGEGKYKDIGYSSLTEAVADS